MKHVTRKNDSGGKSRHFTHKGSYSHGLKPSESSQSVKTQAPQDAKSNAHGSLPLGKDFSDEKKLVMQQMTSKEKHKDTIVDNVQVMNRTNEDEPLEMPEISSSVTNAEMSDSSSSSVKSVVYSSADIKPRNFVSQGGGNSSLSRTGFQAEERTNRTNVTQSDTGSEEDYKMKGKSAAASHTSHLVAANYSFFPGTEESEFEQQKNPKVFCIVKVNQAMCTLYLTAQYHVDMNTCSVRAVTKIGTETYPKRNSPLLRPVQHSLPPLPTETALKSPLSCVNKSPIRLGFGAGTRGPWYNVDIALTNATTATRTALEKNSSFMNNCALACER